ncbi:hypothetical protein [Singulisphaera acidiphila]|nr:hypothetical protein [Singulisphaera acidiphila]
MTRSSKRVSFRNFRRPVARRRRLRREVRMAGYTLLMASPLLLASLLLWGGRPTVSMASARPPVVEARDCDAKDLAASSRPPAISISIEPYALTPYEEVESPVVLPGYLLPDDGCEDTHHAGS